MKDLKRISIKETKNYTKVYCNTFKMCYTYETDNVYVYLSKFYSIVDIDNITYLTVKNTFSAGWTSPKSCFNNYQRVLNTTEGEECIYG